MQSPYPVVLASASPRRKELLSHWFESFEIVTPNVDEDALTCDNPYDTAVRLAEAKAREVQNMYSSALIVAGDTVVALPLEGGGYVQLSKPSDEADARRMLRELSGQSHKVVTGVCVVAPSGDWSDFEVSTVTFRDLTDDEISEYVATGEPMDKAGAYAVQAGGGTFIEAIDGSRTNVIGLPAETLERLLTMALQTRLDI